MIQANELMRNNYVKSLKHGGLITQIKVIGPDYVYIYANPFAMYSVDNIDPIPLSEEILLKCGFVKRFKDDNCNIWDEPISKSGSISLALIKDGWKYLSA